MKKTIQQLFVCLILGCAVSVHAQANPPGAIVMDNADAELDGPWQTQGASLDKYGSDYSFASTVVGKSTATAIFRPKIPAAGKYNVEIFYPEGGNRYKAAKWTISFDGGKEEVVVNQKVNGGKWVSLSKELQFAAGNAGFVQVDNGAEATGFIVIADAVRFVPVGGTQIAKGGFSLNVTAAYGGTVSTSPNQSSFEPNSVATLQVKANDGYVFNGWSGDANGWKNPLRITMNTNKTITANFIAAGVGVIMDNVSAVKDGKWQSSEKAWAGTWYDDYDFAVAKTKADSHATYTPHIPRAGKYDVYIRYAQGSNRSVKVPWRVSHKGGVEDAVVNQQIKGGEWNLIASAVDFDSGKNEKQYAQVSNGTGPDAAGAVVVADAVAFVYIGN